MSTDSTIMLRRNFKHTLRNPTAVFNAILFPVVIMLMFVGVLGGAFNVGVDYIDYATPGLIVLAICYGLSATATAVNSDMTKGIINRFKVMNVSRGAVLNGHVVATMLGSSIAVAVIIGMAFALGFRCAPPQALRYRLLRRLNEPVMRTCWWRRREALPKISCGGQRRKCDRADAQTSHLWQCANARNRKPKPRF